jgi:phosphatidylglycerophosphate synthase
MFDIQLRVVKDRVADPVSLLLPTWATPNLLTLVAFVSGMLSCACAVLAPGEAYAILFWALNRALDCLDGAVARKRGLSTELGGFFDLLGDFVVYSLIPPAISYGQGSSLLEWQAVALLEATFHINNFVLFYIAAVVSKRHDRELTSVSMQPALVEGFESGLFFTCMLGFPGLIGPLSWVMAVAVSVGCMQRVLVLVPVLRRLDEGSVKKK